MGFAPEEEVLGLLREVRGGKTYLACLMGLSSGRARVLGSVPVYRFPESAAIALARAWGYRRWREEPLFFPDFQDLRLEEARRLVEGKRALSQEEGRPCCALLASPWARRRGLGSAFWPSPTPFSGPSWFWSCPPPGGPGAGAAPLPLTAKDAEELLRPLAGRVEGLPAYKELVLRVSRMLEELPQVERLLLELSGPRVAAFTISLRAD